MAETFDSSLFNARLHTRRMGRALRVLDRTSSTNDDAWDALAVAGDGAAVVARTQTQGRGRAGRAWTQVPGRGLALSVALRLGCDVRQAGLIPLAAGLAAARAAHALGVPAARLKWPNDVVVGGRKLAGILCEVRRAAGGGEAVVIGLGLNVGHAREELPDDVRASATSLRLEGSPALVEEAAAEFLDRLEPLWDELQEGDRGALVAKWSECCDHWGRPLEVRTPAGPVSGVARRLTPDGGLVLLADSGVETTVLAGDVTPSTEGCDAV